MKLTKSKLKQIIKEELENISEQPDDEEGAQEMTAGLSNALDDFGEAIYNFSQKRENFRNPDIPNFHQMLQKAREAIEDSNPTDVLAGATIDKITV